MNVKKEKKKYSFNLNVDLIDEIDRKASILGIDRNAYVSALLTLNVLSSETKPLDLVYNEVLNEIE